MFFIVNHENNLIAADELFLEIIGTKDILEAAVLLKDDVVRIDTYSESVISPNMISEYTKIPIDSILGKMNLYQLDEETEDTSEKISPLDESIQKEVEGKIEDIATSDTYSIDNDMLKFVQSEPTIDEKIDLTDNNSLATDQNIDNLKDINDDILKLIQSDNPTEEIETDESIKKEDIESDTEKPISTEISNLEEPLELGLIDTFNAESEDNIHIEEADNKDISELSTNALIEEPISINTHKLSQIIGISEDEYKGFLDEFKQESKLLENDLRSDNLKTSREATQTLKEASLLLHLPHIAEKLSLLNNATSSEKNDIIDKHMNLCSLLIGSTSQIEELQDTLDIEMKEEVKFDIDNQIADTKEELLSLLPDMPKVPDVAKISDIPEVPTAEETLEATKEAQDSTSSGINLEDVETIPFDFSLKDASNELTLPESLVEEFVIDFISQAWENIPILLDAYKKKDLDKIQKTAHMLKGASSNLRILAIADTLYNLQINTDFNRIPELMKFFVGQLKSLEHQTRI